MGQFSNILLAIDKTHTVPQRALDYGPCLGGLNKIYGPNCPPPFVKSICDTRCTNRNQHDILMTAVAGVSKGQTDMSYKGELQTPTKLSMRHQVCPGETFCTAIPDSAITMLMSRGRSNFVQVFLVFYIK